ncbi:RagB/SusD family nutrient uptake outer membrane protein [Bacteroides sp.]|uniref:RagB/SusD family nutrient uptake outer membrane protein n=1 Tax=Bacteroides sp. TaxID=29523 RepID=UPI00258F5352|nr:RagB/SusD family nutrient uptake outer membrane protein [Bacteroides sp.]
MKKIIYYILISVVCIFSFSSCTLDEEPHSEMEKKNFLNNANEAETVLLGVYRTMIADAAYGWNLSILFNLGTDISQVEGSTSENFRIIPTNAFPTSQAEIQNTWATLYNGIYNANDFLERISVKMDSYSNTDKQLATIYIAEARALRALFYFELVRHYNRIPLMTNTQMSYQDPKTFKQAEPEEVYKFIEKDLLYARDILPYAIDDTYRSSNDYRLSKGAILGLLTKVYATWAGEPVKDVSKWELAATTARILIQSGKHSLLPNYEKLWENTCNGLWDPTESLIEISFYSPTVSGNSDPVGRIGKWNGVKTTAIAGERGSCAGNVKVIHTFVLDWRNAGDGDIRRDLSIANYKYDDNKVLWVKSASDTDLTAENKDKNKDQAQKNKQNYTPAKWDIEKYAIANKLINNDKSNVNWYFLRYADVLLLYAEALNEWKHGPTDEAYEAVNLVRRRGYGNPNNTSICDLPTGLDEEEFRKVIRKERAYELAFEGHRRLDLVRWGIYYETVQNTYNALNNWWTTENEKFNYHVYVNTVKGKHELFPIPQRTMDLCTQYKQNPKW